MWKIFKALEELFGTTKKGQKLQLRGTFSVKSSDSNNRIVPPGGVVGPGSTMIARDVHNASQNLSMNSLGGRGEAPGIYPSHASALSASAGAAISSASVRLTAGADSRSSSNNNLNNMPSPVHTKRSNFVLAHDPPKGGNKQKVANMIRADNRVNKMSTSNSLTDLKKQFFRKA